MEDRHVVGQKLSRELESQCAHFVAGNRAQTRIDARRRLLRGIGLQVAVDPQPGVDSRVGMVLEVVAGKDTREVEAAAAAVWPADLWTALRKQVALEAVELP